MSKTLLLVVPPQRGLLEGFSTGLISLGNYVRSTADAVQVRFIDLGPLSKRDAAERISQAVLTARGRTFIGITGTTASYQSMLHTAAYFKRLDPSCVVIFGGHHVTPQDDIVLRRHSSFVDFVIRGEGEIAMLKLVQSYPDISNVPNLSWNELGSIKRSPEAPRLETDELDKLPPTLDDQGLRSAPGKFEHVTYVSARGCPLGCAFCVVRATKIYAKSILAVKKDLKHLVQDLGFRNLAIEDNFFAHQPKRTLELCREIELLQKITEFNWDCQTRVESMKRGDIVDAMARANCEAAYLGVESLVEKHLIYLAKSAHPTSYLSLLENVVVPQMLDAGINVYINLQLGLPGETQSDRRHTLEMLDRLGKRAEARKRQITVFPQLHVIYPGTPHFDATLAKGGFGPSGREVFEEFTIWESSEEPILEYLGEHFAHGVGGIPMGIMDRSRLTQGKFQLCGDALASISTQLSKMDSIAGVNVFKYGQFLTQSEHEQVRLNA